MVAAYDGVFKADELKQTYVADPAANRHQVTGPERCDVLDRTRHYESTGANLPEAAMPQPSGKFARQVVHCRLPARLLWPASKIQLLSPFVELV
jgi:hypothetical protein